MKTITDFLDKWSLRIMLPLVLIIFLKTCSTNSKVEKVKDDVTKQVSNVDSVVSTEFTLQRTMLHNDFQKMLTIEGLKAEKRMIQSTDRKIFDVNRQSEIDKEIEKLERK
jgi:hypothetical protein